MNEENDAVNTPDPAAVQEVLDDSAARFAVLEAEKAKAVEEAANWKLAALKAKAKHKEDDSDDSEDERMRNVAQEVMANSRLAEIAREQDAIIAKALKENRELKLAQLNKTAPPASQGTHTETTPVRDTIVTPEQLAAFKARGWSDKDIERYKKNLNRYASR